MGNEDRYARMVRNAQAKGMLLQTESDERLRRIEERLEAISLTLGILEQLIRGEMTT